jgi:hypothetical protein
LLVADEWLTLVLAGSRFKWPTEAEVNNKRATVVSGQRIDEASYQKLQVAKGYLRPGTRRQQMQEVKRYLAILLKMFTG